MKALILAAALAGAACLSGCAGGNVTELLGAIDTTYAHCERNITYSAALGVLSPGVSIAGNVKCEPKESFVAAPSSALPSDPRRGE